MNDELLDAVIDTLDTLDVYLMANWDEHARKRLRQKAARCYALLVKEQKRRKRMSAEEAGNHGA